MATIDQLRNKSYFTLVGEDLIETAKEMGIKEEEIDEVDLEFIADKMSDGIEWWDACQTAWEIWLEKKEGKKE